MINHDTRRNSKIMDYYQEKLRLAKEALDSGSYDKETIEYIFPELKESEDERIRKELVEFVNQYGDKFFGQIAKASTIAWLEKQGEQKPDFCHYEVDLSDCSEEYRKAYYDGWNNCNQQHAQLEAEQKPAWSEEDYDEMGVIACHLDNMGNEAMANSLLCIRDKYNNVKPKQKQEWSEEDEEMTECVLISLEFFENLGKDVTGHPHPNYFKVKHKIYPNSVRNWLKSLKERIGE